MLTENEVRFILSGDRKLTIVNVSELKMTVKFLPISIYELTCFHL